MYQFRSLPIRRFSMTTGGLVIAFLFVALSVVLPQQLAAEAVGDDESVERSLVLVLEIETPESAPRRYELVTTTRTAEAELNVGRAVPFEATREMDPSGAVAVVKTVQYQDVGVRFRAQVTHLGNGRYRLRGRIEDQQLIASSDSLRPVMHQTSQSVQAVLQPGVPLEVASVDGRVHRVTLRFPSGTGVGAGR